jgi:hypothetical protein
MAQSSNLYERDFYAWSNQQASLPRAGDLTAADIAHIAEEIADHLAECPWSFEQAMRDAR